MKGTVFRRCTRSGCGARFKPRARTCHRCGGTRFSWAFIADVGRDADGKRKQRRRGGFRTKEDAEVKLRELLRSLDDDSYVDPSERTVADFLEREWLPAVQPPQLAPATWEGHLRRVLLHVVPAIGGVRLQELNAAHLNRLYAELRASGRADGKGGLSGRTVRLVHVTIRRALADAHRWGMVKRNVADLADRPRQKRAGVDMKVWSAEQLRTFLEHVEGCGDRLAASWVLVASTGMRRGEVLGLRWEDVDLDEWRLAVRQAVILVGGRLQVSDAKTARSRRTIDLDERTVAALRTWRAAQLEERLAWGPGYQDHGLVFARENGLPVDPRRWGEAFMAHTKAAGLPRIRIHDLRHGHATLMLRAGVNPKIVTERLGHHSVGFTLDTYAHVVPGMQSEAAAAVSALVWGQSS